MSKFKVALAPLGLVLAVLFAPANSRAEEETPGGFWCIQIEHDGERMDVAPCERSEEDCKTMRARLDHGNRTISECRHQARAVSYFFYDAMRDGLFEALYQNTRACEVARRYTKNDSDVKVGPCKMITK